MFKITRKQVDALGRKTVRNFAERLVKKLDLPFDPVTVLKVVEGIERAKKEGVTNEKNVAQFVGMLIDLDDKLVKRPKAPTSSPPSSPPPAAPSSEPPAAAQTAKQQPPPAACDEMSDKDHVGEMSPCPRKRTLRFSA